MTDEAAVRATILRLVERGSHYDVAALEKLYDDDQYLLMLDEDGQLQRVGRSENLALFRRWAAEGATPLSTEAEILHIELQRDIAVALVKRRMVPGARAKLFELRLRLDEESWRISGETVSPWPIAD